MERESMVALTATGADRPGILAGITKRLVELGCNLEGTGSTILRGQLCMVLVVATPPGMDAEALERQVAPVARELGLVMAAGPADADPDAGAPTHIVSVYGSDRPGIVFGVSSWLAHAGANITAVTSRVVGSAQHPVCTLRLEVSAPSHVPIEPGLLGLRDELGVDLTVRPVPADVL